MNKNALRKLIDAARPAREAARQKSADTAPVGFAGRVVARARQDRGQGRLDSLDVLERLGWCGAAASAAICLVAFTLQSRPPSGNPFEILLDGRANTVETGNQ